MIKIGDVIIAKPKFLMEHTIPYEKRHFKVIEMWGGVVDGKIQSVADEAFTLSGSIEFLKNFYLPSNVNQEVMAILDADIELVSFQAVTIDGKIIQIEGR